MKVQAGDAIPEWVMDSVSAQRMRTMAALLRDPNPIHWDRDAVAGLPLGLGHRTINQGPLGLAYIINMLHQWAGPGCLKRITMTFPQVVLDGEIVTARGTVSKVHHASGQTIADCEVWLEHGERGVLLKGTASVFIG